MATELMPTFGRWLGAPGPWFWRGTTAWLVVISCLNEDWLDFWVKATGPMKAAPPYVPEYEYDSPGGVNWYPGMHPIKYSGPMFPYGKPIVMSK